MKSYKSFAVYCLFSLIISLTISYLRSRWPWPRLLSFGVAISIFWLCLAIYFIIWGKNVRMKWDQNVKPLAYLSLRMVLSLFIIVSLFFLFPEYFIGPLITSSALAYLRMLLFVSLFFGFSSIVAFSLGWATSIHISQDRKGHVIRVLSNLVVAISFFGIIVAVFSQIAPSELWIEKIPDPFTQEDLMGFLHQYASTLLYFSSICLGVGFVTTGILMRLVSENNRRLLFFLGMLFCLSIGLVVGYVIGPLLFFAVTEVAFATSTIVSIGLIICMLSANQE